MGDWYSMDSWGSDNLDSFGYDSDPAEMFPDSDPAEMFPDSDETELIEDSDATEMSEDLDETVMSEELDETIMSEESEDETEMSEDINEANGINQVDDIPPRVIEENIVTGFGIQNNEGSPVIGSQRVRRRLRRDPSFEIADSDEESQSMMEEQMTSPETVGTVGAPLSEDNQEQEVQIIQEIGHQQTLEPEQAPTSERVTISEQTPVSEQASISEQAPVSEQAQTSEEAPTLEQASTSIQASTSEQAPISEQASAEQAPTSDQGSVSMQAQSDPRPGPSGEVTPQKTSSGPPAVPTSPESDDEGQICSICFEPWGNSGNHRLSSLKCGHIFGFSCIERWLKGQGGKCPQCNAKATKKDIRMLYAKSLKVLDTSERDRVLKDLEKERESKRKLELEHAQTKLKYELKAQLVEKLQEELRMLKNSVPGSSVGSTHNFALSQEGGNGAKKFRLVMHTALELIKDGGCRVMAYNEWLGMMVVSLPSQVAMFPGCGVKKINVLDMKAERYVPIHQKQIRDLAFNPAKNDLLLSVALDKLIKITNICNNTTVGSFTADAPLWSCCWNADQVNQFFVGTATGSVMLYDTCDTSGPQKVMKISGSGPIVSMCYVPFKASANFKCGGVLVARLQSVSFIELKDDGFVDHGLPFEGPFTSVSFENKNRYVLISCRPSQRFPHARHIVCELQCVSINNDGPERTRVTGNIIREYKGGTTQKVLSRSIITSNPVQPNSVLVCASDESTKSTWMYDLTSQNCEEKRKVGENAIDVATVNCNQSAYLALLTEKSIKFYKWVDVL